MSDQNSKPGRRRRRKPGRRGEAGLSLLEVMVVLAIIGLVAVIAVPQLIGYLDRSKVDTARIQARNLSSILDLYRLDVGRYPTQDQGLIALSRQPVGVNRWRGPYLKSDVSLIDPWGAPYVYVVSRDGRTARVLSYGADGAEGGEGVDADIGS